MKSYRIFFGLIITAALVWLGFRIYRARADLVTLNVRNMDVHKVVPKIEWQTWERIVVNKDLAGNVTLNVRNVPLTEVLNIIGLQTASRWTALYPIYSTANSALKLQKVVRGEIPAAGNGWSNLEKAPSWKLGGGSSFGNTARAANNLVSAQIENKDIGFASLALSRFSQAQVVPEDSANGTINLKLDQAPFVKAVALVAKQVHRKWDRIYSVQPTRPVTIAMKTVSPGGDTNNVTAPVVVAETNPVVIKPAPDPLAQQRQVEAFLSTMTPAERQKAEEQLATMQQINSLPPAERQQRMQEITAQAQQSSQANMEQRIQKRLRDGTVDQRIARDRQRLTDTQKRVPKQ